MSSQAWWEADGAFHCRDESEMVAAAKTAIEGCAAATEGQACYICMDDGAERLGPRVFVPRRVGLRAHFVPGAAGEHSIRPAPRGEPEK